MAVPPSTRVNAVGSMGGGGGGTTGGLGGTSTGGSSAGGSSAGADRSARVIVQMLFVSSPSATASPSSMRMVSMVAHSGGVRPSASMVTVPAFQDTGTS